MKHSDPATGAQQTKTLMSSANNHRQRKHPPLKPVVRRFQIWFIKAFASAGSFDLG